MLIGDPDDAVVFDWDPTVPMSSGARVRGAAAPRPARHRPQALPVTTSPPGDRTGGPRPDIAAAARVVVKVGSSSLTTPDGEIDGDAIAALADALAARRGAGPSSSWSPPARSRPAWSRSGCPAARATWPPSRPRPASGRACSSPLRRPSPGTASAPARCCSAADDLMRRAHYRNAQRTLDRLLELDVLPVVNENDTVVTDEIRFGDNDRLAALVAHLPGPAG